MFLPDLLANDVWLCHPMAWRSAGFVTGPYFIASLRLYRTDQREIFLVQRARTPFSIASFTRYPKQTDSFSICCKFLDSKLICFLYSVSNVRLCLWCSLMKHTISLIWSVGEAIRSMTALPSSGFSGSTLRLQKLLLVILHQHTIDIDSVHSLYTIALLRVSKQHTRAACPMSKMACCSTTSKILIVFLLICSSKSCPHICLLTSFINWGFTIFFSYQACTLSSWDYSPCPGMERRDL